MLPNSPLRIRPAPLLLCLSFLLTACTSTQTPLEIETPTGQGSLDSNEIETYALDQEQLIAAANPANSGERDPWQLVDATIGKTPAESNPFLLEASELFLDQQHYSTAYSMLEEVNPSWLDREQNIYFTLIRARYELLTGHTGRAQLLLEKTPRNSMSRENHARLLQLDIAIAAQQLDFKRAISARMELDPLLDLQQRLMNQRRILSTLSRESQLFTGTDLNTQNQALPGWLALAVLNRQNQLNEEEIAIWHQRYPDHPALATALASSRTTDSISSSQIALLLPLTSRLGHAAQAFKAGFDAAATENGRLNSSRVYDIGSETDLVGLYYQSAVNDGADFIIGPLGRTGALSLLSHLGNIDNPGVSTLLLGELEPEQATLANVWGLSLSPEQDAAAIAEHAISRGMHSALVLQKNNAWGARLASAFATAFQSKGGTVVGNQRFQADQADHSAEIKNLLDINDSDLRHQRLQDRLGTELEFSVRRRSDVDFIFLAGNTLDARRIVPLVKFYRAHDLPIYATSSAFNGKFNKLTDEDLKGLQFTELPWLLNKQLESQARETARLKAEKEAAEARAQLRAEGLPAPQTETEDVDPGEADKIAENEEVENLELPYSSATFNRLYALGYAAFAAIPQLSYLQSDEWYRFDTRTMSLNMDEYRNLRHSVAWGKYVSDGIAPVR